MTDAPHRAGAVAILGRPNAGKSTLLNRILGQKLAIVSNKPQTTRSRILGIHTRDDAQLLLFDTPGMHESAKALNVASAGHTPLTPISRPNSFPIIDGGDSQV